MDTKDTQTRPGPAPGEPDAPPEPSVAKPSGHDGAEPVRLDELVIPALLVMIGGYLTYGVAIMDVPSTAAPNEPKFFPMIVAALMFVVAGVMVVQILLAHRRTRAQARHQRGSKPRTDWKATGTVIAAFLVFAAALLPLGWIPAGTLLFWGVARGLGSRRPVFDLLVALGMSSLIQLAFSAGLGLRLPPGIFGWF